MSLRVYELARLNDAKIVGGNPTRMVTAAANIMEAGPSDVAPLADPRYLKYLSTTQAAAVILSKDMDISKAPKTTACLLCDDPEMAFLNAVRQLYPTNPYPSHIDPRAVIEPSVRLGKEVYVGPCAIVCSGARIGDRCEILAGAYIGKDAIVGNACRIHPYAVIYDNVELGNNVIVHAGVVIGADGFGYKFRNSEYIKVPQVGAVSIGDNVEIGANACIDRATLGKTYIGEGSKLDNQVQVGHNVKIGRHVVVCAQSGIGGSSIIEDYAILAASSGIADHLTIGKGAKVLARSGVSKDVPAETVVFGFPAAERRTAWRELAALHKLPELAKRIKQLENRIARLEHPGPDSERLEED